MRTATFPRKRPDGSFCIEVRLRVKTKDPEGLAARVQSWLEHWVKENRYWRTSLADSEGGLLDFFDDFAELPSCSASAPSFLRLRLESRAQARKWWKDWLVLRLLKELLRGFGEIVDVDQVTDCDESVSILRD